MSKIFVDSGSTNINQICWINHSGAEESIMAIDNCINIYDSTPKKCQIYREDIPKLIKALNKAKELGWWSE